MKETNEYINIFREHKLFDGGMISGSKSRYRSQHPDNLIVFNGNIFTPKKGKIWWGDLDITLDAKKLQSVCDIIGKEIIVVKEMHGRFGGEKRNYKTIKKTGATAMFEPNSDEYFIREYDDKLQSTKIDGIFIMGELGIGWKEINIS